MLSECSIQFLFRDIAEWLHPSDFYQLLLQLSHDAEEDDLITVPYYEISPVIQQGNEDQLHRVLQTCRYWGLDIKDWPDEICHVLWGPGYWDGMEQIVYHVFPTILIGTDVYTIVCDGNLRALEYQIKHGCKRREMICKDAAENGQLECLQYAHEHGCLWDEWTCYRAAKYGQLECLKYVHEHGCPWDERTCSKAAKYGHLDSLQYAHEHGCRWNEMTCSNAADNGQLECLQYAHEHGCPIDRNVCMQVAREMNRENIIHYLLEHQPQLSV